MYREPGRDDDRALAELVRLDFAWGSARALRDAFVRAAAATGVLPFVRALDPPWLPASVQRLGVVIWGSILFVAVTSSVHAHWLRRDLERCVARLGGKAR